ncbi:glycerophosphodiester phosphodiesterase family protein [Neolewinella lacunae]|uniref:Glycerophosphodiester phosphodiesterase family protein n=1 Tax=Neolewinella lacunae TaxID=1517758 RepID=A0A923T7L9_9BACT|nr:glycerophosphodiester phosphodiesterase family protein [Neolewinella lacunae]MBC6993714.1 glycerophosphodiester phosphodiesterase family protein [Neolewinella lacunae]MDN3635740.1 glycerophosphodiester phosphodiesterase family protein [Neolewinella lacunae]
MKFHWLRCTTLLLLFLAAETLAAQATLNEYFNKQKNAPLLICGHRGGSAGELPENSLSRFTALATSFHPQRVMIELDVRKDADGELFVLHDATLSRTTTGTDSIHLVHTNDLRQLHLKSGSGEVTAEKIPTFRAVLDWLAEYENVFLMVDVKGDCWRETTELIREHGLTERCLLLTFSLETTQKAYALLPTAWVSALVKDAVDFRFLQALDLPSGRRVAYINSRTPQRIIKQLHRNRFVLTTDVSELRRADAELLAEDFYRAFAKSQYLGILITDFPLRVKGLLGGG